MQTFWLPNSVEVAVVLAPRGYVSHYCSMRIEEALLFFRIKFQSYTTYRTVDFYFLI